jgi:hypothetical protein
MTDGKTRRSSKSDDSRLWRLSIGAALLVAALVGVSLAVHPTLTWGAVNCAALALPDRGVDSDRDGITDLQECTGLTTVTTGWAAAVAVPLNFPRCVSGLARNTCLDPDSKDLFVIYKRAAAGSLLSFLPNPFVPVNFSNIAFNGLADLGVTVHKLDEVNAATNRTVNAPLAAAAGVTITARKAVKVTESLSTNGTILGNCQFGSPGGLDGCVVYTARARNFINATCPGNTQAVRDQVFRAYATYLAIHETGHSIGGLAAQYNAATGGYHYASGAGFYMDQAVSYTKTGSGGTATCTWSIPNRWNMTLDPPAVTLTP